MQEMSCLKIMEAHEEDQEGTRKPTDEATTTRTTAMMTTRTNKRKVHRVSVSADVSFHAIPGCRDYLSVDIDSILQFGRLRQELLAGSPDLATNQVDDAHFILPPTIIRPIPHRPIHPKLRKVGTAAVSFSSTTDPVNRRRRPTYPGMISSPSIQLQKPPTTAWLDLDYF
jgi:hypothetical protein